MHPSVQHATCNRAPRRATMPSVMPQYKGLIVNRVGLAEIFGVSLPTVDAWVRGGCPYLQRADRDRGIPWQFNTAAVIAWCDERAKQTTVQAIKDRLRRTGWRKTL